jgi:hypothetical protein
MVNLGDLLHLCGTQDVVVRVAKVAENAMPGLVVYAECQDGRKRRIFGFDLEGSTKAGDET